ncbi:MAG TPA: DUF2975 domain-containing protein, partial [Flavobacteriaceae bacterium]|nr:DUF2975 domain-containing protein [Flavobacteriaceae bacterium]
QNLMKTKTETILTITKVLTWIVFIGLCIKTGALIVSFFVSLFVNPIAAQDLYLGLDLSSVQEYGQWHYICSVSLLIFFTGLKAYLAYLVIKIFLKFNLENPFSPEVAKLIDCIAQTALTAGIFAIIAGGYSKWLGKNGLSAISSWDGGSEFLFLAGIIFIIAQVFKKGIELKSENELTI